MKDPADKVTIELSFKDKMVEVQAFEAKHGEMPSPASWEKAIDQMVDERRELLDMLEKVLTTGWELGACIKAQTLVRKLRAIDAAYEAEFSNNEKSGNV
jgi:hypothetical protein